MAEREYTYRDIEPITVKKPDDSFADDVTSLFGGTPESEKIYKAQKKLAALYPQLRALTNLGAQTTDQYGVELESVGDLYTSRSADNLQSVLDKTRQMTSRGGFSSSGALGNLQSELVGKTRRSDLQTFRQNRLSATQNYGENLSRIQAQIAGVVGQISSVDRSELMAPPGYEYEFSKYVRPGVDLNTAAGRAQMLGEHLDYALDDIPGIGLDKTMTRINTGGQNFVYEDGQARSY